MKGYTYFFVMALSPESYIYSIKYMNPVAECFFAYEDYIYEG